MYIKHISAYIRYVYCILGMFIIIIIKELNMYIKRTIKHIIHDILILGNNQKYTNYFIKLGIRNIVQAQKQRQ